MALHIMHSLASKNVGLATGRRSQLPGSLVHKRRIEFAGGGNPGINAGHYIFASNASRRVRRAAEIRKRPLRNVNAQLIGSHRCALYLWISMHTSVHHILAFECRNIYEILAPSRCVRIILPNPSMQRCKIVERIILLEGSLLSERFRPLAT